MKKILVIILSLFLVIVLGSSFFIPKRFRFFDFVYQFFSSPSVFEQLIELKKQNSDLSNQLFALQAGYQFPKDSRYQQARVYSLYPFNTKNRLYITAGLDKGVDVGDPVMFSKTVFVGQIINVLPDKSEVITIFDPKFSLPVKIGKAGVDGLLEGGVSPEISLIDKTKQINLGDEIYSASKDILYGLIIGNIKSFKEDSTGTFFRAQISLPYTLSDLADVYVIKKSRNY
jgi:cell shape-determining protein MreC